MIKGFKCSTYGSSKNWTIPAHAGDSNLRQFQDLIHGDAEKVVLVSIQRLAIDITKAVESLMVWGVGEGAFAGSAEKKLNNMSPKHKNIATKTDALNRLREVMRAMDEEIWMRGGLAECCEMDVEKPSLEYVLPASSLQTQVNRHPEDGHGDRHTCNAAAAREVSRELDALGLSTPAPATYFTHPIQSRAPLNRLNHTNSCKFIFVNKCFFYRCMSLLNYNSKPVPRRNVVYEPGKHSSFNFSQVNNIIMFKKYAVMRDHQIARGSKRPRGDDRKVQDIEWEVTGRCPSSVGAEEERKVALGQWEVVSMAVPGLQVVMFRPGLAQKPRLWPGFRRLRLAKNPGQAKAASDGRLWPGSGLSRGPSTVNAKLQEQESVTRWEFNRASTLER
ncbi:hypothetical protein EDB19DRAFT_1833956 [Suillus lakei]|nr:hypothetical protein EDB19DRAFT_1833956 [Suillus lakei]